MKESRFYLIGNSDSLKSFLITPFDNTVDGTANNDFNYFHSSARIVVECTFGELDLLRGILWKPLSFSLQINIKIIDACLNFHYFITIFKETNNKDNHDLQVFADQYHFFLARYPEVLLGVGFLEGRVNGI